MMTALESNTALGSLRVLDLGGLPTAYASRLLSDFGADVVLVEPPTGDPSRALPPFVGGRDDGEHSLAFVALHTNKRSVTVDLNTETGQAQLKALAQRADVLLESYSPGHLQQIGLGVEDLHEINPGLVVCSVTPFGQTGPFSSYKGTDLHAEAMGGVMLLQGDPSKAPSMSPAFLAYSLTGVHAGLGILHALFARAETGRGQHVDVSMQEANANIHFIVSQYGYNSSIAQRPGVGAGGGSGIFQCSDGWVGFSPIQPNQFQALADWMGNDVLRDPVWQDLRVRMENGEFITAEVGQFIAGFTVAEFVDEAQRRRIPAAPVSTVGGLAANIHLNEREYFQEAQSDAFGRYRLPGPPGRFSETPWAIRRSAPRLGEHNDEVQAELAVRSASSRPSPRNGPPKAPLDGVRITDLTRIWVGPYGTRQLADFGAEVIKIESSLFDATSRLPGILPMHPELNRNKLSITVDLHHEEGQQVVRRLVEKSDVVAENYAPGALRRWGLDYDSLRQVRDDIVYISMPGWGATGPFAHHVLFGLQAQTASGVTHLWGHPDSPPSLRCGIYYADFFVGAQCGFMLETALYHRKLTGQGQLIEVSQVEAQANALGIPLLDYFVNGIDSAPQGNHRTYAAPHGVYPCKGVDAWCAIACATEEEWQGLVRALTPAMGQPPDWTVDPRFASIGSRVENREPLDEAISAWTMNLTPKQVMTMLQRFGVPATAVQSTEDVYFDSHLRHRGYVVDIQHPEPQWGRLGHAAQGARLSETPGEVRLPAPALGQHEDYVLKDLLGMSETEVTHLREGGVLS